MHRVHKVKAYLVLITVCLTGFYVDTSAADDARLADLAGQIEYAFYAQERAPLQQAVHALSDAATEESTADRQLWLNYGRWKVAQLQARTDDRVAGEAAELCAGKTWSEKAPVVVQAVGHALNAVCAEMLAELRPVRSVLYRHDRKRELQQALTLAPKQPQVQFVAAWIALHDGDIESAYKTLQQAVLLYDAAVNLGDEETDWGQAELFYLLGKVNIERHNALAARNALERALVLAPDYRDAAALIRTLSVR